MAQIFIDHFPTTNAGVGAVHGAVLASSVTVFGEESLITIKALPVDVARLEINMEFGNILVDFSGC